jgi:hypothetical protein
VDDTNIIAHCKVGDTGVVTQMQRSLDLWAGGLAATGGQLEPTKTFWVQHSVSVARQHLAVRFKK